jgi:hypothetical protein
MQLLNSIFTWLNIKRLHQIELFKQYPQNVQDEGLFKLIQKAKDTEWGQKYNYENITTVEEFQQNVPLQTYEELKIYVERLRSGEKNILWPGEVKWFAKSSGTTSDKSKFIPVTKEALEDCHFKGGKDVITLYTNQCPESKILSGKGLTLGGSHQINNFSNQSYYGDLSAILIENLPWWVDFIRTPKSEIALLSKWEEKISKITENTIKENVTNIAGVPSWNLVLIKHILDYTGKNNLLEVWPNLELFTHGGVNFSPYREQYKKIIPSEKMRYMEAYNASEGFFAIQDDLQEDGMLLMLDYGIFYEFIPMNEFHSQSPKAITIDKVVPNVNYAIVITTNSGLWRYIIGDTIIFTSTYPHKIKVSGRTRHFINAFGEEVIIDNAEKALFIACEKTHSAIKDYTAGPIYMDDNAKGAHEWLIEFDKEPADLDYFTTMLDNALQSINSDYEAKRYHNTTLRMPIVRKMKNNVFFTWMKEKGKLGGQNKVPRLANDRKYIEEILLVNEKL